VTTSLDRVVRKLALRAQNDRGFARLLSASPAQAVQSATFLTPEERQLLRQTVTRWGPHVGGGDWRRTLASQGASRSDSMRTLAVANRTVLNPMAHVVQIGETLESIALRYTGDPSSWVQLRDLNGLSGSPRPGAVLAIPAGWGGVFGNVSLTAANLDAHATRPPIGNIQGPFNFWPAPSPIWTTPVKIRPVPFLVPQLDIAGFGNDLAAWIEAVGVAGYVLQIRQYGNPQATFQQVYQNARYDWDTNPQPWSQDTVFNIGSVEKFLTAVLLVSITNAVGGVSLTGNIAQYLPSYWSIDDTIYDVELTDVLTHQSGFRDIDSNHYDADVKSVLPSDQYNDSVPDFETMKAIAYRGVSRPTIGSWGAANLGIPAKPGGQSIYSHYANVNFDFLRLVIAQLVGDTAPLEPLPAVIGSGVDQLWDAISIQSYVLHMNTIVMRNAGAPFSGQAPPDWNADALAYALAPGGQQVFSFGGQTGDWGTAAGHGGWYASANTLQQIMQAFIGGSILQLPTPYGPGDVLANGYGIDDITTGPSSWGTYYDKNGLAPVTVNSFQANYSSPGEVQLITGIGSIVYFMPEDITLVFAANTWSPLAPDIRGAVNQLLGKHLH
jgi:CubicO group peptidase (beta-lactamase class C family)